MDIFYLFIQSMFVVAVPLIIVALGGLFAERSGVTNIALEGIMVIGAFLGILLISMLQDKGFEGQWIIILALLLSGLTGVIVAAFHAYPSISKNADQIISATAINILAVSFTILMARALTGTKQISFGGTAFYIPKVPLLGDIPFIGDIFFSKVYITFYIGIAILVVSIIVLYKTRFGLRLRACGENPHAAQSAGINVIKMRYIGVLISGFLAGIAGTTLFLTTTTSFDGSAGALGYGFLGLAVLISGQWKPIRIMVIALVFGAITSIASLNDTLPIIKDLGINKNWYNMLPYITTLVVLAVTSKNSQAPKAAGEPFDPGRR